MIDKITFIKWLVKKKKFNEKSAKDAYSRFERVTRMIKISTKEGLDKSLAKLNKNPKHMNLTMTVRSQLRRSIKLAYEFLGSK
tara:strand:+ start:879 stop:1127 length:249 start_codon:yes stop_codon:yes gene_type:complete